MVCGMMMCSCSVIDTPTTPSEPQGVTTVATFDDVNVALNEDGYWIGGEIGEGVPGDWGEVTYDCTATTGLVTIHVAYSIMDMGAYSYSWWSGMAVSNRKSTEMASLDDQYNNIVGGGANGSDNFGVIYSDTEIDINVDGGAEISYIYMANSAYTMQNVLVGDGYSPKFQNDGDHIYAIVKAEKADGTIQEETVKLAEFTTALSYITGWQKVDLTGFGKNVTKLSVVMTAHNSGVPLYACVDDIAVTVY